MVGKYEADNNKKEDDENGYSMSAVHSSSDDEIDPLLLHGGLRRRQQNANSISPEQALVHMVKVMMGTGMLSLPMAFKYSGLWLGLFLLIIICAICTHCARQLVVCANYLCGRKRREIMDYANVMRSAVEVGPEWISTRGYVAKQLVNVTMFVAQLGFCCVYLIFMADNLKQFFDDIGGGILHISQAAWTAIVLVPVTGLCGIRELRLLIPLAFVANIVYMVAVAIIISYLLANLRPSWEFPAVGDLRDLPLFFGTVIFAFEGISVVLPIENQMDEPEHFTSKSGVLNTACTLVLAIYCTVGFFGYLCFKDDVLDTVTLNLPKEPFYQAIKVMLVGCIMISFPLQFYVPMERIEKWVSRKIVPEKQKAVVNAIRYSLILITFLFAELIPHLALFISLIGAFAGTSLTLIFPPIIDLLCAYSQGKLLELQKVLLARNLFILGFGFIGFATGTYASLIQISQAFGEENYVINDLSYINNEIH